MTPDGQQREITFASRARYFTDGQPAPDRAKVWIVLHGYGQLAPYFIRKFASLAAQGHYVIAPEGLSRFYLSELTETGRKDNRVGASWMTRENRLMDIDNYLRYLQEVYDKEIAPLQNPDVTLLGFSQGCATACRWAVEEKMKFRRLVLWAGLFPPDMDFEAGRKKLADKEVVMVCGKQDPYLTPEQLSIFDQLAGKLALSPSKLFFDGKHEMNEGVLTQLAAS